MLNFLTRRVATGLATLVVALFLMYLLVDRAVDPLADLRESTLPNKEQQIQLRTEMLKLDVNPVIRFFHWAGDALQGNFGIAWRSGQAVSDLIGSAIVSTIELVTAATFLSLLLGVTVGIVSALRQYSAFDYIIIFISFFLYSLPSFFVAVLLKQWVAIGFNDFLRNPALGWVTVAVISAIVGLLWTLAIGGSKLRRTQVFVVAFLATFATIAYLELTDFYSNPSLVIGGFPLLILLLGVGIAFGTVLVFAGLHNRRAMWTSLTLVAIGTIAWYPMQTVFRMAPFRPNGSYAFLTICGLAALTVVVAVVVAKIYGGPDWVLSARLGTVVALSMGALIFVDKVMQVWAPYSQALNGRPIPTIGGRTPNLGGNYWITVLDSWTHLALPTISLTLIAFAGYTRYSRASMLEVMNQDYIRTARAKGLPERLVVVRHGFRNTLIPLATIVPIDVITLVGGAVITEAVFARPGMGQLFVGSLEGAELDPVMAYLLITAALAILANIVADIIYAVVDPRIRLGE